MMGWMSMGESVKGYLAFLRGKAAGQAPAVTEVAVKVVGHELVEGKQYLILYEQHKVSELQMRMLGELLGTHFKVRALRLKVHDVNAVRIIEIEAAGKVTLP